MKIQSKGFSTRYDDDLGGNHIDRLRNKPIGLLLVHDLKSKICTYCGNRRPRKGGTAPSKGPWACSDCKAKSIGVTA